MRSTALSGLRRSSSGSTPMLRWPDQGPARHGRRHCHRVERHREPGGAGRPNYPNRGGAGPGMLEAKQVFVSKWGQGTENPGERILTIEDAYELFSRQENAVALKAVRTGQVERRPTRLLEASLQMRPDRIILGELRGRKAGPPVKRSTRVTAGRSPPSMQTRGKSHNPVGDHGQGRRPWHGVRGREAVLRGKRGAGGSASEAGRAAWGGGYTVPLGITDGREADDPSDLVERHDEQSVLAQSGPCTHPSLGKAALP